jgi:D-3-phosphoglycerate dehydrogenase
LTAKFLVIDQSVHPRGIETLRKAGDVEVVGHSISEDELLPKLKDVDGILVRKGRITARVIDAAPKLKIVARHGVGVDNVDLAAVARRHVVLTTTGNVNSAAVADHTFALILALTRKVGPVAAEMQAGKWNPTGYLGTDLDGKVLGVVGFGLIGRLVARRGLGFGMQVEVVDPLVDAATIRQAGAAKIEYTALLPKVDFLTFHVRLTDETRGMFGFAELARVKRGVRIINTSRGGICDEAALLAGLASGAIAGVGLDVFEREPMASDNPLARHADTVLTPHIGGQTEEAMIAMAVTAAQQIVDCVQGRTPKNIYEVRAT